MKNECVSKILEMEGASFRIDAFRLASAGGRLIEVVEKLRINLLLPFDLIVFCFFVIMFQAFCIQAEYILFLSLPAPVPVAGCQNMYIKCSSTP